MTFQQCTDIIEAGNMTEILELCPFAQGFTGGLFGGALLALGVFIAMIFFAGFYIYHALAWYSIAKKLKYKNPWLAWIPIANLFLIPILAKKKAVWGLMFLVPIANIVFFIIWNWKIFKRRKQPGWFALAPIIPQIGGILYLIAIGIVAWSNKK
jgi:hypothetical protein